MTRCVSTPLSTHISKPAKSVIVATTGTPTFPRRRRHPRIDVVAGKVETITSGRSRRTTRRIEWDPSTETRVRETRRRARLRQRPANTRPKSHGAELNCQR